MIAVHLDCYCATDQTVPLRRFVCSTGKLAIVSFDCTKVADCRPPRLFPKAKIEMTYSQLRLNSCLIYCLPDLPVFAPPEIAPMRLFIQVLRASTLSQHGFAPVSSSPPSHPPGLSVAYSGGAPHSLLFDVEKFRKLGAYRSKAPSALKCFMTSLS